VLPASATACAESGALSPVNEPGANPADEPSVPTLAQSQRVVVTINDGTVAILAAVDGPRNPYEGGGDQETEMWQAPDGSGVFTLADNGNSVAYPDPEAPDPNSSGSRFYSVLMDGVAIPGSDELGVDADSLGGPPTFEAFSQSNPPACSETSQPPCAFATIGGNTTSLAPFGELGTQMASESGPRPGILALFQTNDATGSFVCNAEGPAGPTNLGVTYAYGSGLQNATNSYNVSPASPTAPGKSPRR
jgi:hypothetical protein